MGGFVRDRLLGREGKDIDLLAVDDDGTAHPRRRWRRRFGWAPPQRFERFGTGQIRGGGFVVEVVRARAESYDAASRKPDVRPGTLEEDIWRRDFTVNALCQTLDGRVIDVTGRGLDDLRRGILRTPLDPEQTFSEDPLRMFRAARFAAQLGFATAPGLTAAMSRMAPRSRILSAERVAEEFRRLLVSDHPRAGLELLRDGGLLAVWMPELEAMVGVEQGGFHIYDVFDHSAHTVAGRAGRPGHAARRAAPRRRQAADARRRRARQAHLLRPPRRRRHHRRPTCSRVCASATTRSPRPPCWCAITCVPSSTSRANGATPRCAAWCATSATSASACSTWRGPTHAPRPTRTPTPSTSSSNGCSGWTRAAWCRTCSPRSTATRSSGSAAGRAGTMGRHRCSGRSRRR